MPRLAVSRTSRGREFFVPAVGGWDGFDQLRAFLIKHYAASVVEQIDGPDARMCRMRIADCDITIEFDDPYGSAIVCGDENCLVFDDIARDLASRLESK